MKGVFAALSLCAASVACATPVYNVLLKSGDSAPCAYSATFNSFSQPVINNAGQVLFQARLTHQGMVTSTNDEGVWLWTTGACQCVALKGDPVPGVINATYSSLWLSNLRLDDGGFVTFVATIEGSDINSSNDSCFVWGKPPAMQVVAREDDPIPGATEDERFDDLASLEGLKLVSGSPGAIGFVAKWRGPTDTGIDAGIWLGPATNLQMIALDGHAIPEGDGMTFKNLQFRTAQLNRKGQIVFMSATSKSPLGSGIWTGTTQGINRVVTEGDIVTCLPENTFGYFAFSSVARNSSDQYCIVTSLSGSSSSSNTVILAGPLTNLQVVAREGRHAPGMSNDVVFTDLALATPIYGEGGDVAFRATVSGPCIGSSNNTAIWAGKPGALFMIDRRGSQALDFQPGVIHHHSLSSTFDLAGLNAKGNVVYMSLLEGPGIGSSNNNALWGGTPGFEDVLLQKGQGIPLGNGKTGVVFTVDLVDVSGQLQVGGGTDGRAQSLNDHNQYVAAVQFVAGTGGSALLRIEDVTDPDANGLCRVLEVAHGIAPGEGANDADLRILFQGDAVHLVYVECTNATGLAMAMEQANALSGNDVWLESGSVVSNAADQSGLPSDVLRREVVIPPDDQRSGFFRMGVHRLPPP